MPKREINKTLFRKVRNHILAEPRRYAQCTFGVAVSKKISPCGTQACIAGWADHLENGTNLMGDLGGIRERAKLALGLTEVQAVRVFTGAPEYKWPKRFGQSFEKAEEAGNQKGMARAAANYINHIIRTGKVT